MTSTGASADTGSGALSRAPSLEIRRLSFAYPDGHPALRGIDLTVGAGERVALLGPNGAGKTTLVLHLNGILRGGVGEVVVAGLTVAPPNLLEVRRRVAVATVLAMEPEILVLDEPTSNLDPASRRELADIVRSLDVTTLLVTHDLPFALELCPRSVILSDGRVVADGLTVDLLADEAFLAEHRLELPYGFEPDVHRRRAGAPSSAPRLQFAPPDGEDHGRAGRAVRLDTAGLPPVTPGSKP